MRELQPLPPEILAKVKLSEEESEGLILRELRCPHCNFLIDTLYSDASGHRRTKCPKCKQITIMNMAYFRRVKRKYYPEPNLHRHYVR